MKILILDGDPRIETQQYALYINKLKERMQTADHEVKLHTLRDMDIKYCIGCWTCWWKTPGLCVAQDDSHTVCRDYINADFVLFVSPMIMGFSSALMKKMQDKLIPLVHPYVVIEGGECHHRKRYEQYPELGLLLEVSKDKDAEDFDITTQMFQRFARNLKSEVRFTKIMSQSVEEIYHAIDNI